MKTFMAFFILLFGFQIASAQVQLPDELVAGALLMDSGLSKSTPPRLVSRSLQREGKSDYVSFEIDHSKLGRIRMIAKGPHGFEIGRRPVLLVVSGFFTGQQAVRLMQDNPNVVIIGLDYAWGFQEMAKNPTLLFEFLRRTPGQIAATMQWLSQLGWCDSNRSVVLGVSLGGLFLPSGARLAQMIDVPISNFIFGFTGADLTPVLMKPLRPYLQPLWIPVIEDGLNQAANPLDPRLHAPRLKGRFLTIRALQDDVFPAQSGELLEKILPSPKKHVYLNGRHINPDQTQLIEQTQAAIATWMYELGAVQKGD